MLGRISLLRGDLGQAADQLGAAMDLAERDHWLSFLPWPQALLGQVLLSQGDALGAADSLEQSFARACQIGDPCWEGISARGLALVAEATGDVDQAFTALLDARARSTGWPTPTRGSTSTSSTRCARWVVATATRHPRLGRRDARRASRTGMRELTVRALLHGAALGDAGDAALAGLLADEIDNPVLPPARRATTDEREPRARSPSKRSHVSSAESPTRIPHRPIDDAQSAARAGT